MPDLDRAAAALRSRGLRFDDPAEPVLAQGHYPSTGATGERALWFRDSEGNLIGLSELLR